ncbi:MAG: chloride channel protein [Lentisphaeria bacterium]
MSPLCKNSPSLSKSFSVCDFLKHYLGEKGFVFLLSILVGTIAGLGACFLKVFTHGCHHFVTSLAGDSYWMMWILPAFPAVGIFLCVFIVRYIFRIKEYKKSLSFVVSATTNGSSDLPLHKTFSHLITSGLAVGLGGSAGLEAPIAMTGAAIGSNLAKKTKLGRESRTLLLACGAGAGISAIFNSPVAGTLFACEILLPSFTIPALAPLLMASAAASIVAKSFGMESTFIQIHPDWLLHNVPLYILMGLSCGLLSAYIIRMTLVVEKVLSRHDSIWGKALFSSVILYFVFLLFPTLKGEGYYLIGALLSGHEEVLAMGGPFSFLLMHSWLFLPLLCCLLLLKPMVSSMTIGGGGDGGLFGPSLVVGAFTGYFFYKFLNIEGVMSISAANCIAVGMGGVLAGVMHAPMTGMFLIAEMTGGYTLFVPLMITVSLSSFISKRIAHYNIYKSSIVQEGGIPEMHDDSLVLRETSIHDVVETNFTVVHPNNTLRDLVKILEESQRNICPVLEKDGELVGVIKVDDIHALLFNRTIYDSVLIYDLMEPTGPILTEHDSLYDAMRAFEHSKSRNLPVLCRGKYIGFVSKSGVLDRFRELLAKKQDLF